MESIPPEDESLPKPSAPSNKRLQQTKAQVDEVIDIMRVNVDKVLERDQKLTHLDNRADALQAGASQFEASAGKLKRKFWWKNCKMMLIMAGISALVVVLIVVSVMGNTKRQNENEKHGMHALTAMNVTSLSPSSGISVSHGTAGSSRLNTNNPVHNVKNININNNKKSNNNKNRMTSNEKWRRWRAKKRSFKPGWSTTN